jgi:ribosomal protein L11 methyltransferase
MFVWRKRAGAPWLAANEARLCEIAGTRLAIIETPDHKAMTAEIAAMDRRKLEKIRGNFGGTIKRLPRDWLTRAERPKPIKIGKRLTILRSRPNAISSRSLVIPAGAAFGTGEHATTIMSLRFLEQVTRQLRGNWSMLDLGTGSGILALAGREFGAKSVVAIDSDPLAISVAKANARLNRIHGIDFQIANARAFRGNFHLVSANLYSELLIEILPRLKRSKQLILSGIMRTQESYFLRALRRNRIEVLRIRRRGKWIALLGTGRSKRIVARTEKI